MRVNPSALFTAFIRFLFLFPSGGSGEEVGAKDAGVADLWRLFCFLFTNYSYFSIFIMKLHIKFKNQFIVEKSWDVDMHVCTVHVQPLHIHVAFFITFFCIIDSFICWQVPATAQPLKRSGTRSKKASTLDGIFLDAILLLMGYDPSTSKMRMRILELK